MFYTNNHSHSQVSKNKISELPREIGKLNKIETLSSTFIRLIYLILAVNSNDIAILPDDIFHLTRLSELDGTMEFLHN